MYIINRGKVEVIKGYDIDTAADDDDSSLLGYCS